MDAKHSKGTWRVGRPGTVVTNSKDGFEKTTGYIDPDYYGGVLIAESILKPADAKLIAAAPELLNACIEASELIGHFRLKEAVPTQGVWEKLEEAIKKATE